MEYRRIGIIDVLRNPNTTRRSVFPTLLCPPSPIVFPHNNNNTPSPPKAYFFPTLDMDQSGSTRFRARFDSALQTYQQTTGMTLAEHPLAVQLQSCNSTKSIMTIFECETRASSDILRRDRIMEALESIVSTLFTLSTTAPFGDAIGLVCTKEALIACFHIPDGDLTAIPTCEGNTRWSRHPFCRMCCSLVSL
jgi:hypothetical protein